MRFLRQSLTGLFLASVMLALLIYAGQLVMGAVQSRMADDRGPQPARERVFAVNLRTARMETVTPVLPAFGQIESRRTLELRAAVGGRVIWLAEGFEDGGTVAAGQELVRIDPADAQSTLDRAKSDLLDAEAEQRDAARALVLARDELSAARDQEDLRDRAFQRQKDLQDRGVGTASTVETAELALSAARQAVLARRQAVAQAEARVDQAETRTVRTRIALSDAQRALTDTTITAAFDGTLSNVTLVEGRLVSPNEKLAELIDPDALEIAFRVSTAQYARLLDGGGDLIPAPVTATLDVSGAALVARGRISRDSAAAGEGQTGRMLYARLDSARGFKPGDFVTVAVEEPPLERVVRLPASALDAAGTVLVLGEEDRLEALPVELVRRQGDDVLLRGAGLDGREVVIGRTPLLGTGIRVRPLREEAQAAPSEAAMLELSDERRARLVAFVEGNTRMPREMKDRVLAQLGGPQVPAQLVARIESRIGG
ncbi:efflux RND transporter periplasmic adaptor subunit [Antarcticimicrobium luteum]|uniref:HlyD family efflux transporter periplasmic adaptor subunit n=1 Tax=Antarcticimicrobium luteum TaxID=2547397 RepID=A0A4R5UWV7_9RHOB|nr:HlyD family efflux transporter periplasmic adaptor subunit [Antarcticimicrobium luteum]TDK43762.1 HlyD family efflux transporter periplasmic adaptor subunit [Antarcticimicrobium luteum]